MKLIICLLVCFVFTLSGYSQEGSVLSSESMSTSNLPEMVIRRVGNDFSVYLPEYENNDVKIKTLQESFVAYNLGKDYEGYDNYLVTMKVDDGSLVATYNENGKLTSVVEKYDNVKLPMDVIYRVYKAYPGWKIENDKYSYSQEDGKITQKEYSLKLTKDNESKKIVINSKGQIFSKK